MTDPSDAADRRPAIRIGDADRETAAEQLRSAVGDGRLELAELDDRLSAVYAARTRGELTSATADLEPAEIDTPPLTLRTKSGTMKRTGAWTAPAEITAECTSGSIKLDFTAATVPHREMLVQASAKSGHVVVVVPHGWTVVMDDVSSSSGTVVNKVTLPRRTSGRTVRVVGGVTSGVIKARYPRRRFIDWLLRRPHPALR